MDNENARDCLTKIFQAAVLAADPLNVLARHLPEKPKGECIIVGAGKAAASMASAVELAWPDVPIRGVVVTRYGHGVPTKYVKVREAGHPVPDENGARAALEVCETIKSAKNNDLVIVLISGGGSALLPMPKPPITLSEKIQTNKLLLKSGLSIDEMNDVRRSMSLIKGGGLAKMVPDDVELLTLAISDVPGDNPLAIASGPTVCPPKTKPDTRTILEKLGDQLPASVRRAVNNSPVGLQQQRGEFKLIASPITSLKAAAKVAQEQGLRPLILGDALEGEAAELGKTLAGITNSITQHQLPISSPAILISGGETTVTISNKRYGRGGRNTEFLLSLLLKLSKNSSVHALAADTDGIDGTEDAAGALIHPDTIEQAEELKLDAKSYLSAHDSYSFFAATDCLLKTGPTFTNVNDFRAILIA